MIVYLVVDSYQYDGGVDILSAHLNAGEAAVELELKRTELGNAAWLNRSVMLGVKAARVDCIYIQELEVK